MAIAGTKPDSRQIGRYQLVSVLGQGSMGVVHLARDPQLDREVAIKTIHLPPGLSALQKSRMIQLLLREAKMAARLRHPGIMQVFDVGEHLGEPYLVLEKIDGAPLAETLARQGALDLEFALRVMDELLEAMAYAHGQGIIHRDLKPANIMLQPDGRVRIMDFGIALPVAEAAGGAERTAGTPRYMSPEQIDGRAVDMRSDVFALGVIFYELLAGRRPFPQNDFKELRAAITGTPHPPLAGPRPDLPPLLYTLIDRALAKSAADRYASARAMLEALRKCRDNAENAERPVTEQAKSEIVDFILQRIARQGDFPATSQYLSAVTQAARNEQSSAHSIAECILKDFALTNRILRMVNSPFYRQGGTRQITTISHAVVLLGINTVLDVAAGLGVFEHFHNRCNVPALKVQAVGALMTGIQARELARQAGYPEAEEAFICGMLHHLGRLIVAFYFPEEFKAITQLVEQGTMDEAKASRKVMRLSYAELSEAVAGSWRLPETVLSGLRGLDPAHKGPLRTPMLKLQGVVSCASQLSKATMITDEHRRKAALADLSHEFEGMIDLKPRHFIKIIEDSVRNAWDISHALRVNLKDLGVATSMLKKEAEAAAGQAPGAPEDPASWIDATSEDSVAGMIAPPPDEASPSQTFNDPLDETGDDLESTLAQRTNFLMKAIGEIAMAVAGPFQINDVLMMVIEGMFRGIDFQHVLLALVTPRRDRVICRYGLGPRIEQIRPAFDFPLTGAGGLPARCVLEAREFYIANLNEGNWKGAFTPALLDLLEAQSIVLLPIIVRGTPIGLFCVDRTPGQEVIGKQELLNLRTLRNQAVLAIDQSQSRK